MYNADYSVRAVQTPRSLAAVRSLVLTVTTNLHFTYLLTYLRSVNIDTSYITAAKSVKKKETGTIGFLPIGQKNLHSLFARMVSAFMLTF